MSHIKKQMSLAVETGKFNRRGYLQTVIRLTIRCPIMITPCLAIAYGVVCCAFTNVFTDRTQQSAGTGLDRLLDEAEAVFADLGGRIFGIS